MKILIERGIRKARMAPANLKRGSALLIALVVLTIVATMGVVFLQVTTSTTRRQVAEGESMRAFYLAEAGLAESFQAVRMGRTGQVGSEDSPAVFGGGLLWVDATETADNQVRLECTALIGRGRTSLALIVEPVEVPLGFFAHEDLVIEEVLLVDGFNSEEATYKQELVLLGASSALDADQEALLALQQYAQECSELVGQTVLVEYLESTLIATQEEIQNETGQGPEVVREFMEKLPELRAAHAAGELFPAALDVYENVMVSDSVGEYSATQLESAENGAETSTELVVPSASELSVTTGAGGLLASNGDVSLGSSDSPVAIHGDVIPGPGGKVQSTGVVFISGDTAPRSQPVELEPVIVPTLTMAAAVRHTSLLPQTIAPGTSGHERIEVAADSELILRGPATIVIGELILEPGAVLRMDTRDGNVDLYVTDGMDLQTGSFVETSSEYPDELTIQVAAIPTALAGAPVKLDATSQFHGTIYSPQADVHIGSDFEVYGGVVAKRLELDAGARLHFDNARYEGSPIPRVVSWQIVEVPASVTGGGSNPYRVLGVEPGTLDSLSSAHNLDAVWLDIEYLQGGMKQTYEGTEDLFNWGNVDEIVKLERDPTRVSEGEPVVDPDPDPEPAPVEEPSFTGEAFLLDKIADADTSSSNLSALLIAEDELTQATLLGAVNRSPPMEPGDLYGVMEKAGRQKAGFPSAQGDGPLPSDVLLRLIESEFPSKELSWVLEQNSPLPASVLSAAENRSPPMSTPHLNTVRRAQ